MVAGDISSSSVLLTYKGKVLLLSPDNLNLDAVRDNIWSLIGGIKSKNESFEDTVCRKVEYFTKLTLKTLQPLSNLPYGDKNRHFYVCKLTDEHVNHMERREGKKLEFFTWEEAEKLTLSESASTLFTQYKNEVKELLNLTP